MAVITLTSDLGLKDHYVAVMKGAILSNYPAATIIDISHLIQKFDTSSAAYLLKNAYKSFPQGSVHIIAVNDQPGKSKPVLAVEAQGHYFIGTDNGVFSLILEDTPSKTVEIETQLENPKFPAKEIFINAACHLVKGGSIDDLGQSKPSFQQKMELTAYTDKNTIRGAVIYVDSYGNAITNINISHFQTMGDNRGFSIEFGMDYSIDRISSNYDGVSEGEIMAVFNSSGNLEIAVNKGSAAQLLGIKQRGTIRIEFDDN
jgi:S-adenosyl-L-methionine hydrolase (adenosine-forming)